MNAQQLTDLQPWILLASLFVFLSLETLRPLITSLRRGWYVLHNIGLLAIQIVVNLGVSFLFVAGASAHRPTARKVLHKRYNQYA